MVQVCMEWVEVNVSLSNKIAPWGSFAVVHCPTVGAKKQAIQYGTFVAETYMGD